MVKRTTELKKYNARICKFAHDHQDLKIVQNCLCVRDGESACTCEMQQLKNRFETAESS